MKLEVKTIEMGLAIVNKEMATFNINGIISGVVHLPASGPVTVVLDGGYVLGEFHCPVCAVKHISLLSVKFAEAQNVCGMSYYDHKRQLLN
ncbi:hypothetical protein WIC93_08045 [Enterobacter cloacae]|uniref:hypothetical protein n=1 Tax=Enterobacter TaxID=547 RepID=UPI000735828C|nr:MULTISPECIES: hypothetical protein [Enterobacter]EKM5721016.1 hypothetical protein [Enterobacter cloacae]EKP1128095.1 hypothetical protein [Enterobacter cloacae]EKU2772425.1 hypothetical protein [Enterobacter cloacae]EKV7709632.1 hypothetical protein [Enterobacter cloacae]ELQ9034836.1 hypothetical protein [Enterobacter cloacae]